MARGASTKSGISKVRLVVFEAEVSDGDLTQFTNAIQNALMPRQQAAVRVISSGKVLADSSEPEADHDEDTLGEDVSEVIKPRATRSTKPRAVKPPKVIDGIDWDADPGLKSFVENFDLKTMFEKYLVIALWFKDYRDTPAILSQHIYTAFRHLNWSTSIADFDKPFRNMRENQLFTGGTKEGFSMNQLGEGKIKAKRRAVTG